MTLVPPNLALVALPFEGRERLFDDGLRARGGIHLRWSFRQDLGFPPGGFSLYRSMQPNLTDLGPWGDPITTPHPVKLPSDADEAFARIRDDLVPGSEAIQRYRDGALELIELLRPLLDTASDMPMHRRPVPAPAGAEEATVENLFALDVLLMTSLDPCVARMLGLYWIDEAVTPGWSYFYKVVGHWGSREWPLHEVDLTGVSPREAAKGELEADGLQIFAGGRRLTPVTKAEDDIYGPYLRVSSDDPTLPLRIVYPAPVVETNLRIDAFTSDPAWRATVDGRPTTLAVHGSHLTIHAHDGAPFRRLDLSGADPSWYLYSIGYRERVGPVGDIHSEPVRTTAAASAPPVTAPRIATLKTAAIPALLEPDGRVAAHRSQVEVSCHVPASPQEPLRAVRLHVGRSPAAHLGEPAEILTQREGVPVLYQPPHPEPVLPELLADWAFDGHTRDGRSGREARLRGRGGFVRRHPRSPGRRALSLRGAGFVETEGRAELEFLGAQLTLDAWVRPHRSPGDATIIGNDRDGSLWLGLRPEGEEQQRIELRINGRGFSSSRTVPIGRWTRVTAVYDGAHVVLYLGGELDSEHRAELGPVRPSSRAPLCIGADSGSTTDAPRHPFSGELAEVRIWKHALHPDEADDRLEHRHGDLASRIANADLLAAWPEILDFSAGATLVEARDRPELGALGRELTLQAWVHPRPGHTSPTLVGNNWGESFWLGLLLTDDGTYRARLWLNRPESPTPGVAFHSSRTIPADEWTHVTVTYDGRQVRFYLDGEADASHPAGLGPVRDNPERVLVLGAESGSRPGDLRFPYAGLLADVRLWRRALSPEEAERRLSRAQFIDHRVPDGDYAYRVQGIDLFGRVSEWSAPQTVSVVDHSPPPPPVHVRARYLPLTGSIVGPVDGAVVPTDITVPAGFSPAALEQYDAVVERVAMAGRPGVHRQSFEIEAAAIDARRLVLTLRTPPFAQLRPGEGDALRIEFDGRLEVTWGFTGRQRLFAPQARDFRIYRRPGPLNTLRGRVLGVTKTGRDAFSVRTTLTLSGPAGVVADTPCQVGAHRYTLVGHSAGSGSTLELRYAARPVIAPKIGDVVQVPLTPPMHTDFSEPAAWGAAEAVVPLAASRVVEMDRVEAEGVGAEERAGLRDAGVTWLPDENLYRVILRRPSEPPAVFTPDEFVPGVLVARTPDRSENPWHALTVLWHGRTPGDDLTLYVVSEDGKPFPSRLLLARYHPGERYRTVLEGAPTFPPGEATVQYALGLSTTDDRGNQSGVSGPVTVVAVDRRRPPRPEPPIIERIDRADYYGQSRVSINWVAPDAPSSPRPLTYLLYRATDSAVFARDLEQRRLRTGHYRGLEPEEVIADDVDFADWLPVIARRLGWTDLEATWRTALFAPRPAGLRPTEESPADPVERAERVRAWEAWDLATPVWRAWADRFYPALTNEEVRDRAERMGNETAFALVHERPLDGTSYVDSVNGLVRNRHLYRLRAQSPALLASAEWGPVSDPESPPQTKPPRAPVFTKVEVGDRQITLDWTLNPEPDVAEYRLYRAETPEELSDLRWWGDEDDPRLVATIPDPLLRVRNDPRTHPGDPHLILPPEISIETVLGVFRYDEFDGASDPIEGQTAFNYWRPSESHINVEATEITLRGLRRFMNGTPVVILYRDFSGDVHIADRYGSALPYLDANLRGRTDYAYRIVAALSGSRISEGSEATRARTLELSPPELPEFSLAAHEDSDGSVEVELITSSERQGLEVLVQRQHITEIDWRVVAPWQSLVSPLSIERLDPDAESVTYRVSVRTFGKQVALDAALLHITLPGAAL